MSALFAFHLLAFVLTADGRQIALLDRGPVGGREVCEVALSKMFASLKPTAGRMPSGSILLGGACKVPGTEI